MFQHHILKGLNPYKNVFPLHTNELIQEIAKSFDIPVEKLDRSVDSLYLIDSYLIDNFPAIDQSFVEKYILNFIAYVGEIYIANRGGEWSMVLDEDKETWEPRLQGKNGKIHSSFFVYIYKTLVEDDQPSIRSCYLFSEDISIV